MKQFCEDVKLDLQQVIDQEVAAFKQKGIEHEIEAHKEFAEDRCRHFIERQDILRRIRDYLSSDDKAPLIIPVSLVAFTEI